MEGEKDITQKVYIKIRTKLKSPRNLLSKNGEKLAVKWIISETN
jgi:hypothetical protein